MKFKVRDLVITTDKFGRRTFAIIGIQENGYLAVALKSKKRYLVHDDQISTKFGILPENSHLLDESNSKN